MRIAVVGSGGREHTLVEALAAHPDVERLFALPGNAGTAARAENVPGIGTDDGAGLVAFAEREGVDLTVIGPEAPLVAGVADRFLDHGLAIFGPTAAAARIEGSKAFAKEIMGAANVPTARAEVFGDPAKAVRALDGFGPPWVIKADGLASGKGVTVTSDPDAARAAVEAALVARAHGEAGERILLEEYLDGPEASLFALSDGRTVVPLAPARDYKRVDDGDRGPNTGGMGAYSPLPDFPESLVDEVRRTILEPTVAELAARGGRYQGLLYAGLALTSQGPKVVEFNCRFGDPEAQVVVPRLASDLTDLLWATAEGGLAGQKVAWDPRAAVTVVLASGGYPGSYRRGLEVHGVDEAEAQPDVHVYHAGTTRDGDGTLRTAGGRVLAVTALGGDLSEARARSYAAAGLIRFGGVHYRRDIGILQDRPPAPVGT
ncbi:MAG TPA: phosphoribosylamine--glycine ligase [Actinomycetes bacterium]|jgi:phosphoribosylamine--glycine ligase|nr:phosphoribosylamine--glycine ligase [Actinomycetes bacterium]